MPFKVEDDALYCCPFCEEAHKTVRGIVKTRFKVRK